MMATKKKKAPTKGKLVKKLDSVFSLFTRLRDAGLDGHINCITCGCRVHWKKCHACHFIGRWNYLYRRDEENVNAGCVSCNTYRAERHQQQYTLIMIDRHGREKVEEMLSNKRAIANFKTHEILEKIDHYKQAVKELAEIKKIAIR